MNRTLPTVLLSMCALAIPAGASAAGPPNGTYSGTATSTDRAVDYGASSYVIKNGRLVAWNADAVPRQCRTLESTNFGFTVAGNVLKAYGLTRKDMKVTKKGWLRFTYTQPSHTDRIRVNVRFGRKKAAGTIVNTAGAGEPSTLNCSGSARVTLTKRR